MDTVKKEEEIEEKLQKEQEEKERSQEEASSASIFSGAKFVDTTQRENEIEDKLSKMIVAKDAEKKEEKPLVENAWRRKDDGCEPPKSLAYRPPDHREDGESRRDDMGSSGYDGDRRNNEGGYDRDRRDNGGSFSGYDRDRRDDRGGYDGDDRGYDLEGMGSVSTGRITGWSRSSGGLRGGAPVDPQVSVVQKTVQSDAALDEKEDGVGSAPLNRFEENNIEYFYNNIYFKVLKRKSLTALI